MWGVGNPRKAKHGFVGQTFYFCSACGRVLKKEQRAEENKHIAEQRLAAKEAAL